MNRLLIFGLGYCGTAISVAAAASGFQVTGTTRAGSDRSIRFDSAAQYLQSATHVLTTAAPADDGDPVLAHYADQIRKAPFLRWIGYLSSTVVYGDQGGRWVDEDTPAAPRQPRGLRRLDAENAWAGFADRHPVDVFRECVLTFRVQLSTLRGGGHAHPRADGPGQRRPRSAR